MTEKWRDAIYGLAIGDAMGVPYEFRERGTFWCEDMTGYGTHLKPAGTWSDDTSMTLATAKSIKDHYGEIYVDDIRRNFQQWFYKDAFTVDGLFDVGGTTAEAIMTGRPLFDEKNNGNGSLMRILPLAFTKATPREIMEVSAITHGNEISLCACVIYVQIARRLLRGETIYEIIPSLTYEAPFDRLSYAGILQEDEVRSSGYVVDTLEAALWCLFNATNYREAILLAVNLGLDTDTTAAVTGGLAGIIWPLDRKWLDKLRGKDIIEECI